MQSIPIFSGISGEMNSAEVSHATERASRPLRDQRGPENAGCIGSTTRPHHKIDSQSKSLVTTFFAPPENITLC
jgi:hypothetical protein